MQLGKSLYDARKKSGLSQEQVAEKLGISRQTISKWELDESLPDIRQAKHLASIYHVSLDDLIQFDLEVAQIEESIERISEETQKKVDWNKVWSKKYPILTTYQNEVQIEHYQPILESMLSKLKTDYGYSDKNAFLVLKDILAKIWMNKNTPK